MIIHITYVKPVLTTGLTVHDCGDPRGGVHVSFP